MGIHFTWKPDWPSVKTLLPALEAALAPFEARPHWGKLFTMEAAQIRPLYARLPDFLTLLDRLDPQRKFRNAYLESAIGT